MPDHRNVAPAMSRGRETWKFSREEVIEILKRETGAQDGDFLVWGLLDTDGFEQVTLTLVRDYQVKS